MKRGELVFPKKVEGELARHTDRIQREGGRDKPYEFVSRNSDYAARHGDLHEVVRQVLAVAGVTELLDPDKPGVEDADPYVLATAKYLRDCGFTVRILTEDRKNKPNKLSLAAACGLVGIPVVPMQAFLLSRGVATGR